MIPKIMGILNATPDSFYDKGTYFSLELAIKRAHEMVRQGASIIDIGGESTRPNATPIIEDTEYERVIPLIKALNLDDTFKNIQISIDTMKPSIAEAAIQAGASLINDVTGFRNPEMISVAAKYNVDICVMHMQGTPANMQLNPQYPEGIMTHLMNWFEIKINELLKSGIKENSIIIDPGIGFGKTVADNLEIIHNLPQFKKWGFRVLLGVSRKSFMSKILNKTAADLLIPTVAINTFALSKGVNIIRVHDVMEHQQMIELLYSEKRP